MVPVEADGGLAGEEGLFGPTAMLLCGFTPQETEAVRALLADDLGAADHVALLTLTRGGLAGTLRDAFEGESLTSDTTPFESPETTFRAVVLSGMYGGEVQDVIGAWRARRALPEPVWAAAVPGNYDNRTIAQLLEDVAADDAAMKARAAGGGE
jgi:hypothetical protein